MIFFYFVVKRNNVGFNNKYINKIINMIIDAVKEKISNKKGFRNVYSRFALILK